MGHESLVHLEIKKNKLVNTVGIGNMGKLEELYLNENEITDFSTLKNLPKLKKLDLNINKIANLKQMPNLPCLEHLDLGANAIELPNGDIPELAGCTSLRNIVMAGNTFADALGDKLKIEVVLTLKKIKFVGEDEINDEDRTAAKEEAKERKKAAYAAALEADRLAMERAAAGETGENQPEGGDEVLQQEEDES